MQKTIQVIPETTPNPHSMKFNLSRQVVESTWEVEDITKAGRSPIAQKILGFPWAVKVFIGKDFITVNKENWVEWDTLVEPLSDMIKEHIQSGQTVLHSTIPQSHLQKDQHNSEQQSEITGPDARIVAQIKKILEKDIQPAVAMDGGFIDFSGYKNGTVFLKMKGACSGCPSAEITLKQGIETHLKNQIEEVKQVVSI